MKFAIRIIILFSVFAINAQNQISIQGTVLHDSVGIQDIHVINKTTKMATTTKLNGKFSIPVSLGDTIEFTSIVYKNRKIAISENHIQNKLMLVYLESHIEELNEIRINQKRRLVVGDLDIPPNKPVNHNKVTKHGVPDMNKALDPTRSNSSVDFIRIFHSLTKKIRKKRKDRIKNEQEIARLKKEFPDKLKYSLGEDFFAYWLKIPSHEINLFIDFCQSNGLGNLYKSKDIEVTDFLIKQSRAFESIRN
jgi:hypothetical protein